MASKLSFRSRQLDPSKPMPIYRAEDVPDLGECTAISRGVPVLPSGMEKEEEGEHHLQRAISAQQAFGHTGELVIPTPEVYLSTTTDYGQMYSAEYQLPRQLIHMQLFAIEQDNPDYDMDSEDEYWLKSAKIYPFINFIDFEKLIDKFEKHSSQHVILLTEAKRLANVKTPEEEALVSEIYDYWLSKRINNKMPLLPAVKIDKRDNVSSNSPYVAFRRRMEKMQTRKNRKNDETSYEKMLKLRRDLSRAKNILDMIKRRERLKRDELRLEVDIFKKRYEMGDYSGHVLAEAKALLSVKPLNNINAYRDDDYRISKSGDNHVRKKREYRKRPNILSNQKLNSADGYEFGSSDDDGFRDRDAESDEEDTLDGPFSFKRKKGCSYYAARQTAGNWPWSPPSEGGMGQGQYKYCLAYLSTAPMVRECIGYTRRRVGRGGRIILDRAHSPDNYVQGLTDCY